MSDAENALRRWWLHERPAVAKALRDEYVVRGLDEARTRLLHRACRESFLAGFKAARKLDHGGTPGDLFPGPPAPGGPLMAALVRVLEPLVNAHDSGDLRRAMQAMAAEMRHGHPEYQILQAMRDLAIQQGVLEEKAKDDGGPVQT